MLSDALYEAETAIHHYQTEMPEIYGSIRADVDALRCKMIMLRLRLDSPGLSDEWLERNPIYAAAKRGDVGPHDAFQYDEDDSVLEEYSRDIAAYYAGQDS